MKNIIDYYYQDLDFLSLVKSLGGCIENQAELEERAKNYTKGYFFIECKKANVRLKGIDEVARIFNMPSQYFSK